MGFQLRASATGYLSHNYAFLSRMPTTGVNVPPLIPSNVFDCTSDTTKCVEEYVYRAQVVLWQRYSDWKFGAYLCCLPNASNVILTNMTSTISMPPGALYAECGLNNVDFNPATNGEVNHGVFWHNRRPNHTGYLTDTLENPMQVTLCEGVPAVLDQSVRNYDGDSIHYKFVVPKEGDTNKLVYTTGHSFANPIPTLASGPLTIDSTTGEISLTPGTPTGAGVYLIGIQATEYRYDTVIIGSVPTPVLKEIGYTRRSLTIHLDSAANCPSSNLTFADAQGTPADSTDINCTDLSVDVYMSDEFWCNTLDTNGSCVLVINTLTGDTINVINIESSGCNGGTLSNQMKVFLDPSIQAGNYQLYLVQGTDSNTILSQCYNEVVPFSDTLNLTLVLDSVGEILGDLIAPNTYAPDINVDCFTHTIDVNLSYPVNCSDVASNGSDFEIKNISTSPPTILPIHGATTVCNNNRTQKIQLQTDTFETGTYWLVLKQGSDSNTLVNLCDTEWSIDSIQIFSPGPTANLGKDTVYCEQDTGFQIIVSPGNFAKYFWNTGDTTASIVIDDIGTYVVTVQDSNGCEDVDTLLVTRRDCTLGINEINDSMVNLFPNPTSKKLNVIWNNALDVAEVRIYTALGKLSKKQRVSSEENTTILDVSAFHEGTYVVQLVTSDGNILNKRFNVIH